MKSLGAYCFLNNLSPQSTLLIVTSSFFRSLLLLKKLERALLGHITGLLQLLQGLQARSMLLLGHDAALASLHQVLLGQATGSVLGRAVPHLGLRAYRDHLTTGLVILTSHVRRIHRVRIGIGIHFYIEGGEFKPHGFGPFSFARFFFFFFLLHLPLSLLLLLLDLLLLEHLPLLLLDDYLLSVI